MVRAPWQSARVARCRGEAASVQPGARDSGVLSQVRGQGEVGVAMPSEALGRGPSCPSRFRWF